MTPVSRKVPLLEPIIGQYRQCPIHSLKAASFNRIGMANHPTTQEELLMTLEIYAEEILAAVTQTVELPI